MDLALSEARAAHAAGLVGPAELACTYVAHHVRRIAGSKWLQGPRRPALDPGPGAPELVRLFATREVLRLPRLAAQGLVAWAAGLRDVELSFSIPTAAEVLSMQARGRRVVSLLDDGVAPTGPKAAYGGFGAAPGLGFVIHDLCHLEKFTDPAHHLGQVGFFAALEQALAHPGWAEVERGFDARYLDERDHVLADMNGSSAFLFLVLRNKVKLAVRRQVAAARGGAVGRGELDPEEAALDAAALEVLVDALALEGPTRAAALSFSSRDGAEEAGAETLLEWAEARGREALSAAGRPVAPPR